MFSTLLCPSPWKTNNNNHCLKVAPSVRIYHGRWLPPGAVSVVPFFPASFLPVNVIIPSSFSTVTFSPVIFLYVMLSVFLHFYPCNHLPSSQSPSLIHLVTTLLLPVSLPVSALYSTCCLDHSQIQPLHNIGYRGSLAIHLPTSHTLKSKPYLHCLCPNVSASRQGKIHQAVSGSGHTPSASFLHLPLARRHIRIIQK